MKRSLLTLLLCLSGLTGGLQARVWTEAATGRKIEADFVSTDAGKVTIAMKGGARFTLELARLSAEDREYVKGLGKPAFGSAPMAKPGKAEDRFEDVRGLKADTIPVSGLEHPALKAVDAAVRQFMADRGVPAITLAFSREGKILHDCAFGWAQADLKTPLQTGIRMRLASMTKPVVSSAIQDLFAEQKLKPEDLVFNVLELDQYKESKSCDARWKTVTIQHLLDHKGGWDTEKSGDIASRTTEICDMFRIKPHEMEPIHIVRHGLTLPMDSDPGAHYAYSNYGYILLARVIEKVSGKPFAEAIQASIGQKSGATSFSLSRTDARDRPADEIWYCYHPEHPAKEVPLSFHIEARDGAADLACTAADYCRFLETYWLSGKPRVDTGYNYNFNGSYPATTAICSQRTDGLNYAAIANRRSGGTEWNDELRKVIDAALEVVAKEVK